MKSTRLSRGVVITFTIYVMKTRCNATAVQLAAVLVLLRSVSSLSLYFDVCGAVRSVCVVLTSRSKSLRHHFVPPMMGGDFKVVDGNMMFT